MAGAQQTKDVRKSLSREMIVVAAMQLLDREPFQAVTMSRLGRELGVDPTAVYRHFRNRDELILALGDLMIGEGLARAADTVGDWEMDLRRLAWAYRSCYLARPALAVEVAPRFTGGPNGRAKVEYILRALRQAGLDGEELARQSRAYLEVVFGHIGLTAALVSLPDELQSVDVAIGLQIFTIGPRPQLGAPIELQSAEADEADVFDTILETYLAGLRSLAERTKSSTKPSAPQ